MRTYKIAETMRDRGGELLEAAVRAMLPADVPVNVNRRRGTIRVGHDGDPQIVRTAVESAGYHVERVDVEHLI